MSGVPLEPLPAPSREELEAVVACKLEGVERPGWAPRMRRRFRYFTPDEWYEALVARLVFAETRWCDVGCGRHLFPSNEPLARRLAARCRRLVGVDPDVTIEENPYLHDRVRAPFDEFATSERFDLVTMRMVAEHVERPERLAAKLAEVLDPGGRVVIYTVHRFSPVPLITGLVPFSLHQPIKRLLWRTESKDTFPTRFRMNTRSRLKAVLGPAGFSEEGFWLVDDCRTFGRFRVLLAAELFARTALRGVGLPYPERCILAVHRRD